MSLVLWNNRWVWLGGGLIVGLLLTGFWPDAPLHATATDRTETFAVATGPVDGETEMVIMLDFLTGDMAGRVLGPQSAKFQAFYQTNVIAALTTVITQINAGKGAGRARKAGGGEAIEVPQKPRFLMVTGAVNIRRRGAARPGACAVYVVETTTGIVMAFGFPWAPEVISQGRVYNGQFILLDSECFRVNAAAQ